ncbi:MAG TPA: BTAD domain-containing putative transcriptional regulator [Candidatus Limnocylindrales bacterium]|nr:BTAD domain-containing putative transcriptional regulator [Candidatus Limnocylindrales bacterium]
MASPRVRLFGGCTIDGRVPAVEPTTATVLIRLVIGLGKRTPVAVDEIYADVWMAAPRSPRHPEAKRKLVQQRVKFIRDLLGPDAVATERGRITTYRLALRRDEIDVLAFLDLISAAREAGPVSAITLYEEALDLWRGDPLLGASDKEFARDTITHLLAAHRAAQRELAQATHSAGRVAQALAWLDEALAHDPDDERLRELERSWRPPPVQSAQSAQGGQGAPGGQSSEGAQAPHGLEEMANGLARAVSDEWKQELAARHLRETKPLPLSWRAADPDLIDIDPPTLHGSGDAIHHLVSQGVPTGRLVLLGGPGAGKTMLLTLLVEELLARRQPGTRVPVLVSPTSWDPRIEDFPRWLARQIIRGYPVLGAQATTEVQPMSWARALFAAHLILPILDGLDEMRAELRREAIQGLNSSLDRLDGVIVACRADDYRRAVWGDSGYVVRLSGATGIELSDVNPEAVASYLRQDDHRSERWNPVIDAVRQETALARVLRTPLMISMVRSGYAPGAARIAADLTDTVVFPTEERIQSTLFDEFMHHAYQRKTPKAQRTWSEARARRALGFLARHMRDRETTELGWWQLRDATPRHLVGTVMGTVCGLGVAIAVGLSQPLTAALGGETDKQVGFGPGLGILIGLGLAWIAHTIGRNTLGRNTLDRNAAARGIWRRGLQERRVAAGLAAGLAGGLVGGFAAAGANLLDIGTADWPTGGLGGGLATGAAIGPAAGVAGGLIGGAVGGFVAGLATSVGAGTAAWLIDGLGVGLAAATAIVLVGRREPAARPRWSPAGMISGAVVGGAVGLAVTLVASPVLGIIAALAVGAAIGRVTGLGGSSDKPTEPATPAAALARDSRAFKMYWLAGTFSGGLVGLLSDGLDAIRTKELSAQLAALAANGLAVGLAAAIACGVILGGLHSAWPAFAISRLWLSLRGHVPWRLMGFLADARERGVLRQLGPAYQFRHERLQQFLADGQAPELSRRVTRDTTARR